jgi:hypothetical protein
VRTAAVEPLDHGARLVVAAEIDRRVLRLEGMDTRIGRPVRIEREAARKFIGDSAQPLFEGREAVRVAPVQHVNGLDLREDISITERRADDRQNHLAERSRHSQFGETPLGRNPIRREDQDHSMATRQLAFTGRESNPLDRVERFQIIFSFPFPGLLLALPQ